MLERGIGVPSKPKMDTPTTASTTYAPAIRNTSEALTYTQMLLYSLNRANTSTVIAHQGKTACRYPFKCRMLISAKWKSARNHSPRKKDPAVAITSRMIMSATLEAAFSLFFSFFEEPIE